jgi:peptidoglycan/LPS O-acetylase OafA/YrhL
MSSTTSESGLATTSETSSRHIEAAGHEWFPGIEVLRGFAATAVVIEHCWALAEGTGPTDSGFISYIVLGLGEWGVDLFFLLSGFLLAEFFWAGKGKRSTLEFYVRRFFRIAPAYYFCVAILFLFFAEHSLLFSVIGIKQIAANATFTQWLWPNTSSNLNVNGSLWTLTIEMMLYISMPLLAWLIAKRPVVASLTLAAVGIAYRLYVALDGTAYQNWRFGSNPDVNAYIARLFLSRQFFGYIPIFVLGMALRWAIMQGYLRRFVRASKRGPSLVVAFILLLPSLIILRECERASIYQHWVWFTFFDYVICLLMVPALLYAARPFTGQPKTALRGGVWLGERSYGLYLWHFPVILSFYAIGPDLYPPQLSYLPLRIIGISVVSLALAATSYAFIEKPARLHGRGYAKRVAAWSTRRRSQPRHVIINGKRPS